MARVSFPLASLNLSGGVKNTLAMADAVAAAGHAVTVLVPDLTPDPPFALSSSVRLRVLGTPRSLPKAVRRIAYYVRLALESARGQDVCVVPYYPTVHAAWVSSLLGGGRCRVVHLVSAYEPETHGALAEAGASRPLRALLARLAYRLPVERVYVSGHLARRVGEPDAPRITLGIDHSVFHARGRSAATDEVGVIARSGPVKGYDDFLAAWRLLGTAAPPLVAVRVDPVEIPAGASALGRQTPEGMAQFYRRIAVFAFTSLEEGFPAPPLEAMACGAAVVSTRCGGVEEYAVDGLNALLVPAGDPRSLAEAIRRVSGDGELRARLAREGARTAAHYTADALARDAVSVIERALSPSRSATAP